jgi:acetyltransferase-like isoleucine patch superfamily enzyme
MAATNRMAETQLGVCFNRGHGVGNDRNTLLDSSKRWVLSIMLKDAIHFYRELKTEWFLTKLYARAMLVGAEVSVGRNPRIDDGAVIRVTNGSYLEIGDDFTMGRHAEINVHGGFLTIGDHFQLLSHAQLNCRKHIEIQKNVALAPFVFVTDFDHDYSLPFKQRQGKIITKPVYFGKHSWVGAHSVVLKGVSLGAYSGVGANSVVTRSVADRVVVAGNPAKPIKVFPWIT